MTSLETRNICVHFKREISRYGRKLSPDRVPTEDFLKQGSRAGDTASCNFLHNIIMNSMLPTSRDAAVKNKTLRYLC